MDVLIDECHYINLNVFLAMLCELLIIMNSLIQSASDLAWSYIIIIILL